MCLSRLITGTPKERPLPPPYGLSTEVLEHIRAVGVDFLCRWGLPYLANMPRPVLKGGLTVALGERTRDHVQNLANVTGGGNAMRVGRTFRAASSFSGSSIITAGFLSP